ncbi:hypothetical protein BD414DRAFT_132916 [Trametes punicea]|nr:hypothetical protein BD414DRAFT_132916 [Trametes punicea]
MRSTSARPLTFGCDTLHQILSIQFNTVQSCEPALETICGSLRELPWPTRGKRGRRPMGVLQQEWTRAHWRGGSIPPPPMSSYNFLVTTDSVGRSTTQCGRCSSWGVTRACGRHRAASGEVQVYRGILRCAAGVSVQSSYYHTHRRRLNPIQQPQNICSRIMRPTRTRRSRPVLRKFRTAGAHNGTRLPWMYWPWALHRHLHPIPYTFPQRRRVTSPPILDDASTPPDWLPCTSPDQGALRVHSQFRYLHTALRPLRVAATRLVRSTSAAVPIPIPYLTGTCSTAPCSYACITPGPACVLLLVMHIVRRAALATAPPIIVYPCLSSSYRYRLVTHGRRATFGEESEGVGTYGGVIFRPRLAGGPCQCHACSLLGHRYCTFGTVERVRPARALRMVVIACGADTRLISSYTMYCTFPAGHTEVEC